MTEKMIKVRQATWAYMRENYPDLWEKYRDYISLPVEDYGHLFINREKAEKDFNASFDELESIIKEVYRIELTKVL